MTEKTTEFHHSVEKSHVCLHLHTKNLTDMIYSSWEKEPYRLKLVIIGHLLAFCSHKNQKKKIIKILKKKKRKKFRKYHHFTHVYQKSQSYDIRFLRYRVRQTEFFVILDHFLPFYSTNNPQNENFEKMKKNNWGFYWFTLNHHKWQSYHVWFLKHGGQQRALFYHQKQTNFNIYLATLKKNENLRDIIFYTCLPVPEIKSLTDWNW